MNASTDTDDIVSTTDPPADLPSRHGESIIMTTDGILQQQARWNQLKQRQHPPPTSRIVPPEDRILPPGTSLARSTYSTSSRRHQQQQQQQQRHAAPDGNTTITTEPQYYATLEDVQSISVCSELSTTFISGLDSNEPSTVSLPNIRLAERSLLTEPRSNVQNTNPHPLNPYNYGHGFDIDDDDDDVYTTTTNQNMNENNENNTSFVVDHTTISNEMEEPQPDQMSMTPGSNQRRRRSILIIVVLIAACTAVVGGVCGAGICSRDSSRSSASTGITDNDDIAGYSDNATADIELYLRNISLTKSALEGGGNTNDYETLQQADMMAMEWIINNFTSSNDVTNITDPMSQQRLRQLFAIVTMFYSSNNAMNGSRTSWNNASNWLEPKIHECDWYGIECNDEEVDNATDENIFNRKLQNDFENGKDSDKIIDDEVIGGSQSNTSSPESTTASPTPAAVRSFTASPITSAPTAAPITATIRPTSSPSSITPAPTAAPLTTGTLPPSTPLPVSPSTPTATPISTIALPPSSPSPRPPTTPASTVAPMAGASIRTITSIALPGNNLIGPMNPNIGLLTDLTKLVMSNNALTGTIPTTLSLCTNMTNFQIRKNNLSGTIPNEIVSSWYSTLRRFDVGSNVLNGTIPTNIGIWNDLRFFVVQNNQLTGAIPNSISNWTKIVTARFDRNDLNGSISDDFCTFAKTNNASITVDRNEVLCTCCDNEGVMTTNAPETVVPTTNPSSVPPNLQPPTASPFTPHPTSGAPQTTTPAPTNVPVLGDTYAPVVTTAPAGSPVMTMSPVTTAPNDSTGASLIRSYIQSIAPSGGGTNSSSPTFTAEQSAIQWLEENSGSLQLDPSSVGGQFRIGQWYALRTLYHSTNGPSWVMNWENTGFDECSLYGVTCGTVQDSSGNVYSIVYSIRLPQNGLIGQLPVDLALLPYLSFINASINSLTGTIPEKFVTSTMYMTDFLVYNNMITGTLPASLGSTSWPLMLDFDVHNNAIGGTIPETISEWDALTRIDLSGNVFTGEIPLSICYKFALLRLFADEELAVTCLGF